MKDNEVQLKKFTKAIKKGVEFVHTHTPLEIANLIVSSFPSTDISTIEKVVARYKSIDAWTSDLLLTREGFDKLQDVLKEAKELTNKVDYETLVTTKYL
jgi:NitT/TauT family transport system substrate-binding protein